MNSVLHQLNNIATKFLRDHSFDVQVLVYAWHDRETQRLLQAALRSACALSTTHRYSVRVMNVDDTVHTAVQCATGAMVCTGRPLQPIDGDLGYVNLNTRGDDLTATITYEPKKKCFVLRILSFSNTSAWLSVGNRIQGVKHAGAPAMILQRHTVFRVGTHRFRVVRCRAVRHHMQFNHALAPVASVTRDASHAWDDQMSRDPKRCIEDEIAQDEENMICVHCFYPATSTCCNKMATLMYNHGGQELRFGDSDACAFRITDGSVSGITCRVVPLLGEFWLIDGPTNHMASASGTYVRVTPDSKPVPLRSSYGLMRLVFEPQQDDTPRSCADVEIVECV